MVKGRPFHIENRLASLRPGPEEEEEEDAAKSGLTPKGRYVMRDINDWHKK